MIHKKDGPFNVAIVGLGAGTLACYAEPGERWTFYEIDPVIQRIASDPHYFTFLADSRAESIQIVIGDARLRLREAPEHGYQVIILDAFSSDSLPVHLITREAVQLYKSKLAPGGLIVFNLSNRYLDLEPVVTALAIDAGLVCRIRADRDVTPAEKRDGKQPSIWAVLAARVGHRLFKERRSLEDLSEGRLSRLPGPMIIRTLLDTFASWPLSVNSLSKLHAYQSTTDPSSAS